MDPLSAFEIAKVFFSGISAAAAAIQVWYKHRDVKEASTTFDQTYKSTLEAKETADAAIELIAIIPEDVIKELEARADNCWNGFRRVLNPGEYLPDEVDKATEAVQACVCRELSRIAKLNGAIPPRWKPQWQRYECATRGRDYLGVAKTI